MHRELWVPAEELETFNQHLIGPIRLVRAYYGEGYVGPTLRQSMMPQRLTVREQLPALESIFRKNGVDFMLEIRAQRVAVQLNFVYWVRTDLIRRRLRAGREDCDPTTRARRVERHLPGDHPAGQ
jgi:hypothetical protein